MSEASEKTVSNFELIIISYGHAHGPLTLLEPGTVEQLTFSVRDMKNPPAKLRKTHTGLSSHLRKEVMANHGAAARLSLILEAVRKKMGEMKLARQGIDISADSPSSSAAPSTLVVGIMCERGKHRSVTFAEELSRSIQADDCWAVSVQHRELDQYPHRKGAAVRDEKALKGNGRDGRKPRKPRDLERMQGREARDDFCETIPNRDEDN
ncbi:hypothetical protein AYO20_10183 [Fonsecaea nubica]|uniref:RapZ C-terminal domain-containing protein n=1 Tax=Fonsecaea nubica TaxID=856822 RepID=A0A178C861_9EURO|nr:hypothetical protein AYO20_10183 [Fonsecaea nubica]OAL26130.1 hypothetical protein AYO20_10183 [Fonsecaea nubica]